MRHTVQTLALALLLAFSPIPLFQHSAAAQESVFVGAAHAPIDLCLDRIAETLQVDQSRAQRFALNHPHTPKVSFFSAVAKVETHM